jgi:hypothetical protein
MRIRKIKATIPPSAHGGMLDSSAELVIDAILAGVLNEHTYSRYLGAVSELGHLLDLMGENSTPEPATAYQQRQCAHALTDLPRAIEDLN